MVVFFLFWSWALLGQYHKLAMRTRRGLSYTSPPPSPGPRRNRRNTGQATSTPANPSLSRSRSNTPLRRKYSSSTDEGEETQSVSSLVAPTTPSVSAATSVGSRGSATRKKNPARTNKRGIDLPHQKQLLEDLEASGGLFSISAQHHGIPQFCNKKSTDNEATYGAFDSKRREQVRNKLRNWVRLGEEGYESILISLGVVPFKYRQGQQQLNWTKQKQPESSSRTLPQQKPAEIPEVPSVVQVPSSEGKNTQYRDVPPILDDSDNETPRTERTSRSEKTSKMSSKSRKMEVIGGVLTGK